jgi:hypothetical protein
LICGDWRIPYNEVRDAALVMARTAVGIFFRLIVWRNDYVYQFALSSSSSWRMTLDPFWLGQLPFPIRRIERSIGITGRRGRLLVLLQLILMVAVSALLFPGLALLFFWGSIAGAAAGLVLKWVLPPRAEVPFTVAAEPK